MVFDTVFKYKLNFRNVFLPAYMYLIILDYKFAILEDLKSTILSKSHAAVPTNLLAPIFMTTERTTMQCIFNFVISSHLIWSTNTCVPKLNS